MQQIRIARNPDVSTAVGLRFACEWMEDCQMNRWLLKVRLAEAIAAYGPGSHWIDTRAMARAGQLVAA